MSQPSDPKLKKFNGMFDCMLKTIQQEGPLALYKGIFPNWLRKGPHCLIFFVGYEQFRYQILSLTGDSVDYL